jgi:uncharacterized membrane protein YkgB
MVARLVENIRISNSHITSVCIGIVYAWFGMLKFFPGGSPAEALAKNTIDTMTLGLLPSDFTYATLAGWETALGILFILNIRPKWVIYLALIHMGCTFMPLFFFPEASFQAGASLTLTGQYIIKNLIIISALISLFPRAQMKKAGN